MTERKNEAHDMVMESLTQALLQLMEKKPLSKINVSELCTRAGVGRVSFTGILIPWTIFLSST